MPTAITKDFITRNGIIVQGTNVVTSSTGQLNAGQFNSGVAIQKNLIVGNTATVWGPSVLHSTLDVDGVITALNATNASALTSQTGAIVVENGGIYVNQDVRIDGTTTGSSAGGALYLSAGGAYVDKSIYINDSTDASTSPSGALVLANGGAYVKLKAIIDSTANTTGMGTGALQVNQGGAYINQDTWIDGVTGASTTTAALYVSQGGGFIGQDLIVFGSTAGGLNSGALRVDNGGAYIDGDIYINGTTAGGAGAGSLIVSGGGGYVHGDLYVNGGSAATASAGALRVSSGGLSVAQAAWINSTATAVVAGGGDGALRVEGGAYINDNLIVNSLAFDTGTNTANALYVAGGAWIDKTLLVDGQATFRNDVFFQGTATFVYSTNTVYTDNLLQMHMPPGGDINNHVWAGDDGKDIGLIFHYYKGSDKDAFLGFANDTGYLEWYENGSENTSSIYVGTTYGTFKTGAIKLTNTTPASNTYSGALTVEGGVGIGGDVWIGGALHVDQIISAGDIDATVTTATNLKYGNLGEIPIQSATGQTTWIAAGTATNQLLTWSTVTSTATWTNPTGFVAGAASNVVGGDVGQIPFQSAPSVTVFDSEFKYDTTVNELSSPNVYITGTLHMESGSIVQLDQLIVKAVTYVNSAGYLATDDVFRYDEVFNQLDVDNLRASGQTTATFFSIDSTGTAQFNQLDGGSVVYLDPGKFADTDGVNFAYSATNTKLTVGDVGIFGYSGETLNTADSSIKGLNSASLEIYSSNFVQLNFNNSNAVWIDSNGVSVDAPDLRVGVNETTGTISMYGSARNIMKFPQQGVGAPTTSTYSDGSKIVLWDNVGPATSGYAIGIDVNTLWFGLDVYSNTHAFKWYGRETPLMTLTNELLTIGGGLEVLNEQHVGATTSTGGSVHIKGGVGIAKDLYVATTATVGGDLFVDGTIYMRGVGLDTISSTTGTFDYVVIEGTGTGLDVYDDAWVRGSTVQLGATGANQLENLSTTTLEVRGGWGNDVGALSLFAGNYPTTYSKILLSGDTTIESQSNTWTFKSFAGQSLVTINQTTASSSPTTGAVVVYGGVGIQDDLWIGDELHVAGLVEFTNTTQAQGTGTDTGSVKLSGGLLVKKNIVAGGLVIGGDYSGGASPTNPSGQVVEGFKSNNNMQASYTSPSITSTGTVNLDVFSSSLYTTAKYLVQVVDGSDVHSAEILLIHDGSNAYFTEYAILTNNGELGVFGASLAGGNVTLTFAPTNPTTARIQVVRQSVLTTVSEYAV